MDILFQGTVAKFVDRSTENEDAFFADAKQGRVVVCDGASESFDAKGWARLLADTFSNVDLRQPVLIDCQARYEAIHNRADMSWSKAAAYDRGSFTTLLIAQDDPETQCINITCVGDSFVVLTDGERIIESLPYHRASDFNSPPLLLSTVERHNTQLWLGDDSTVPAAQWSYQNKQLYLLCMTDALGAWLLSCIEQGDYDALRCLIGIRCDSELIDLVEIERDHKVMRRDDSTLIIALLKGDF